MSVVTDTHIVNLTLGTMVDYLRIKMIDEIDVADPTRASVIKKGLLQTQKTQNHIQIGVTGGDHEDPNYKDGILSLGDLPEIGFIMDPREIGGGQMWMRRFVARLEIYYIVQRFDEDTAHEHAYNTLGRLMSLIEQAPVAGLTDTFGEKAIKTFCFANTFFESGGPPASYIFRGKILFQVLTERP